MNIEDGFRDKVMDRLEAIEDIPSLPLVITRLTEAIQNVDSSASDVAKIMEDDPAIMARVLKMVNSSFYAGGAQTEPVTNVRHAIVRLGYDAVRNIALTSSVFSVFKDDHAMVFDRKEFWRHCICTGIVANVVCDFTKYKDGGIPRESVALAGLLHDMGKIIMEQYFYDMFTKILDHAKSNDLTLFEIETQAFKVGHCEIGAWLAKRWKLSPEMIACIEFHHEPERAPEEFRAMVSLVHVADYICNLKRMGQSGNPKPPEFRQEIWEELGLNVESINEIVKVAEEEAEKSEILLSLMS
jgi:putative nucleotidyltransferase with HDIG domain